MPQLRNNLFRPMLLLRHALGVGKTELRYSNVVGFPLIESHVAKCPSITSHLEPRTIRSLPWVETKHLPSWAGKCPGALFRK
jgi:hypothetical protein